MVAKADLEKRVARIRDRIQKADENGERPLPPDAVRRFRKRLKRTQRKLTGIKAMAEKQAKSAAAKKPAEGKAAEAKAPEEPAADTNAPEEGS